MDVGTWVCCGRLLMIRVQVAPRRAEAVVVTQTLPQSVAELSVAAYITLLLDGASAMAETRAPSELIRLPMLVQVDPEFWLRQTFSKPTTSSAEFDGFMYTGG